MAYTKDKLIEMIQTGIPWNDGSLDNIAHSIASNMCPNDFPCETDLKGRFVCRQCWERTLKRVSNSDGNHHYIYPKPAVVVSVTSMNIAEMDRRLAKAKELVEALTKARELIRQMGG